MAKREERKAINVEQVAAYLANAFSRVTRRFGLKNQLGTQLYVFQVEFMYMLDDIRRGPAYIVPKRIAEANELIDNISKHSEA